MAQQRRVRSAHRYFATTVVGIVATVHLLIATVSYDLWLQCLSAVVFHSS
jgi:hypothetical protein